MKVLVFFSILVVVFAGQADAAPTNNIQFALEGPWEKLLEMIREFLKEGYPDSGIAPLDPFDVNHTQLDLSGDFFKLKANIRDGVLYGLSDFKVDKFEFSKEELLVDFNVNFPSLNFSAEYYEMEGDIIDAFPLAGQGILQVPGVMISLSFMPNIHVPSFEVYDITIGTRIYFKKLEDDESVLIDRFENPGFSVSRIVSKTQYDGNFDDILNAMAEDLLAGYLNRFNKFIAVILTDRIIDPLNDILANL